MDVKFLVILGAVRASYNGYGRGGMLWLRGWFLFYLLLRPFGGFDINLLGSIMLFKVH
jgi:hypothetical protein